MPHINDAMARSLRSGWTASRSIVDDANNVKNSFSSWSNCMAAAYCKWPVVVAIIIGGLILLSVVWCIVRCACCGMSCCCSCFSCLKCCGNCCGCCDPPNGKKHKHLDDPYYPPQQGYKAPMPMMSGGGAAAAHAYDEPPQFAQFETGPNGHALEPKKVNEDALPPMPSWDTASKKRIMTEQEKDAMELGELDPATGQKVPLMTGAANISRTGSPSLSPALSPYGEMPGHGAQNGSQMGHMGAAALGAGALGAGAGAMAMSGRGNGGDSYGRNNSHDNGYGAQGQGRGRGYPQGQAEPYDQYSQDQGYDNHGAGGFGAVGAMPYRRGPPQRQYSNDSHNQRPVQPPQPQRQYSNDSNRPIMGGPQRPYPSDPIPYPSDPYSRPQHSQPASQNQGFNVNPAGLPPQQNYARRPSMPQSAYSGSTAAPTYQTRQSPPPQQASGYPGYKPYSTPSQARGPPAALMPGGRVPVPGREEQGWNPV